MSSAQRNVLGILLVIVFLDLAVSRRLVALWNHAFSGTGKSAHGSTSGQVGG